MTLYLLRHGESEGNAAGIFSGTTDHPLTATGRQQALAAAPRFLRHHFSLVVTSELSRAIETADLVLQASQSCVERREIWPELNERDFGEYENVPTPMRDFTRADDPHWRTCFDVEFSPPGGESMRRTHERAVAFLEGYLMPRAKKGDVLAVGHGNILRSMTLHHLGWPLVLLPEMPSRNCLITTLSIG